jgi:hypothetical protein
MLPPTGAPIYTKTLKTPPTTAPPDVLDLLGRARSTAAAVATAGARRPTLFAPQRAEAALVPRAGGQQLRDRNRAEVGSARLGYETDTIMA